MYVLVTVIFIIFVTLMWLIYIFMPCVLQYSVEIKATSRLMFGITKSLFLSIALFLLCFSSSLHAALTLLLGFGFV